MFWSRLGLIGLTVLWLAASSARAQTDLPLDPITPDQTKPTETGLFLEIPSVYGAAKYDQKVNEAPAAVIIITAEQIRKYGYRNFAQILDSAPGLVCQQRSQLRLPGNQRVQPARRLYLTRPAADR